MSPEQLAALRRLDSEAAAALNRLTRALLADDPDAAKDAAEDVQDAGARMLDHFPEGDTTP